MSICFFCLAYKENMHFYTSFYVHYRIFSNRYLYRWCIIFSVLRHCQCGMIGWRPTSALGDACRYARTKVKEVCLPITFTNVSFTHIGKRLVRVLCFFYYQKIHTQWFINRTIQHYKGKSKQYITGIIFISSMHI